MKKQISQIILVTYFVFYIIEKKTNNNFNNKKYEVLKVRYVFLLISNLQFYIKSL